ncbi:hypothetical protein [Pseudobacteriovorax antillogorgiicola]|uniref:Uncharacterized protein n=1 Tax=Pseudobacteriovorax antillogorgiicola TaxID=1513793 RepID=A0A1Y6CCQ4_9BACT|nr:hypothetical protein [Pseudobacteriovorax antillogorgiicola]TCS48267.1 hypothetical protein EDD56_11847 [Pseudobacteriovorax antillogorgiicola]SMF57111.1 hypothetical protein SAMN06296036_11894 [Pseudobacteriovorax antillogorgiicola]
MRTIALIAALTAAVAIPVGLSLEQGAKESTILPENYEALNGDEKLNRLWQDGIIASEYKAGLPTLKSVSPFKLAFHMLSKKMERPMDEAEASYDKPIHKHGVVAKVAFVATQDSPYTGLFEGASQGLLRVSVTGDPASMTFAPGIALKFFRDGMVSQNVSALYKLSGQGENHNFFANELSNVIPLEFDIASIFSSLVFKRVAKYPTQISVDGFADYDEHGDQVFEPRQPRQLYFSPVEEMRFDETAHDFRQDFMDIPSGTTLYRVYASEEKGLDTSEIDWERRKKALFIGTIETRSRFIASEYGDRRLFFKHNRML